MQVWTRGRLRRTIAGPLLAAALLFPLAGCGEEEVGQDAATPDAAAPSEIADTAWMDNAPPTTLPVRDTVVGVEPPTGTAAPAQAPDAPR